MTEQVPSDFLSVLIASLLLSGCEVPPPPCPQFAEGQIVRHRASGYIGYYDAIGFKAHFVSKEFDNNELPVICEALEAM